MVSGPVSDGLLDWDDQIVDPDWAAEKLGQWFSDLEDGGFNATIHQMHSPLLAPAGKGKDLSFEDGVPWVRAKIVEPTAVKLIDEGVYRAYSIGILDPPIFPDPKAKNGRIGAPGAGGFINECSLVDTPANPRCIFSLAKRAKAGKPIRRTEVVEIIDEDQTVPLHKASREQLTKAFVRSLSDGVEGGLTKALSAQLAGIDTRKPKSDRKTAKALASATWYALVKRDMDPDVGGGVDRDTLKPGDYVFPDTKNFPVVTPGDVSDAVSSWGRYKGSESFESFKTKLTALARRKGPNFVKELPESWGAKSKKGSKMTDTATKAGKEGKAPKADKEPKDDSGAQCPTCKGEKTIMDGNRKCPDCNGTGKKTPSADDKAKAKVMGDVNAAVQAASRAGDVAGAAVSAAVTKSLTKDADDDVDDALEQLAEDVADAVGAQADDDSDDKPTDDLVNDALGDVAGAVSAAAAAQGMDQIADVMSGKKKGKGKVKKAKKAKKGKIPPQFAKEDEKCGKKKSKSKGKKKKKGDSTAIPSDTGLMTGGISKSKKGKGKKKGMPSVEKRLHDILCPAYSGKALKSVYPVGKDLPLVEVLAPDYFAAQMEERSRKGKGDIAEAYQALAASTKLSTLKPTAFLELRDAAAKGFMDAYPDVHLRPQVIDPEAFQRSFLGSSNPETSSVTRVPMPDLKDVFGPSDFQRGPLTTNEARPTLSSGTSVAKGSTAGAGNPNSRTFYTNSAKDESQNAMAMLHDHIVSRYPGVCPMEAAQPGTAIDSDGQMGTAAEMQAKGPGVESLPIPPNAGESGTLRPIGKKAEKKSKKKTETRAKVGKAAGTVAIDTEAIKGLVNKGLRKERRQRKRTERRLGKKLGQTKRKLVKRSDELQKALSAPNPRQRAHLGTSPLAFTPKSADPEKVLAAKQQADRTRALKSRAKDPNSQVAQSAIEELMRTTGSPQEFAKVLAADAD